MISAALPIILAARRVHGDCLHLSLQLAEAQPVQIWMFCFQSGWVFEADLGVVLPHQAGVERELLNWPAEPTLLQVQVGTADGSSLRIQRWLAAPTLRRPFVSS